MTHEGGVRHPITSTIGASAGAVSPANSNSAHTGAGFFIIDKHGWLAGAGHHNIWQSFGGDREGNESAWETAARELEQETGILAEHLVSLAPPFTMRKDAHVYVLHIARVASRHNNSPTPSRELTRFKHFTSFGDAFRSELSNGEIVHRRDIQPEFLTIAAEVYRALLMRAQAAAAQLSQPPDSDSSAPSVPNTQHALHKRGAASLEAVDAPYSAPTTMSREAVFLSPPIGALGAMIPFFDLVRLCPEKSHTPPSTVLPRTAHSIHKR